MTEYSEDTFADDVQQGTETIGVYSDVLQEDVPERSQPEPRPHGAPLKTKAWSTEEVIDVVEDDDVEEDRNTLS